MARSNGGMLFTYALFINSVNCFCSGMTKKTRCDQELLFSSCCLESAMKCV